MPRQTRGEITSVEKYSCFLKGLGLLYPYKEWDLGHVEIEENVENVPQASVDGIIIALVDVNNHPGPTINILGPCTLRDYHPSEQPHVQN